jgi:exodeoxyribonuclease V beta subunit
MTYQPVEDILGIDLGHHGLIEASAGTGKTYTIENLVVRLLREETDVDLENILLVTFTEKAASELKVRIRDKMAGVLEASGLDPAIAKKLRRCMDEFDRAAIHTIHGFCQGILRDFALENGAPFESEVVPDGPLYETLLKEQMRRSWPHRYGGDLKEMLEISRFNERPDEFQKTVLRLSMALNKRAGDRLLPDLGEGDFQRIREEIASICIKVKSLIQPGFPDRYNRLNFNATAKRSILEKMVVPLEKYFSGLNTGPFDLGAFYAFMAHIEAVGIGKRKGLDCLIPEKWNKGGANLHVCPELQAVMEGLKEAAQRLNDLRHCLMAETVHRLQADVALTKQARGWISYADMLNRVETALYEKGAAGLLKRLRDRFRVAFIDEFQDTDPVQWRIFRKIFIDSPDERGTRLFVIGDPKQAIYAFRGADVYAYLSAKVEMERLAQGTTGPYSLAVNWRSQPPLIKAFNTLFGRHAWFRPQTEAGRFEIGYQATKAPGPADALARMVSDSSGRPPLTIVDLGLSPSPKPAKLRFARFVAQEIRHLMGSDVRIWERGKGERSIGLGDMAILVRGRSDVPFLEDELKRENIPYAFYKKTGLFDSDEAVYTRILFHAMLDPGDGSAVQQALLTPFFGRQVRDLYAYEETPPTHPVKEILFRWNGYAMTRQWGYLFQSLMEDSGLLTRGANRIGWDRQYTNYRQIFEYLEAVAYRKNLDFRGMSALLDLQQNALWEMEEGRDIHQIETESDKVQIMTMHVSKGLQFPVVFVAGGLTQPASHREAYHVYHPLHEGRPSIGMTRVFDLLRSGGEGRHEIEKAEEDKRLYYVAATRAQFKLYLPFYTYNSQATWLGPVCTLLSPALMEAFPRDAEEEEVLWLTVDPSPYGEWAPAQSGITGKKESPPLAVGFEDLLIPQSYAKRRTRVDSFSGLHQERGLARPIPPGDLSFRPDQPEKEPDEPPGALIAEGLSEAEGSDGLPGGTDIGLMFHGILERMDYGVALRWHLKKGNSGKCLLQDPGTREIVLREMAAYRVDPRWQGAVCDILWNTLITPIPGFSDGFCLARLKSEDRLHEAAFYYPFSRVPEKKVPDEERGGCRRWIRGFIDLIFRKGDRYYVADWKSNTLETGYDLASMARSMAESDYHLQYQLYAIAALRWLRQSLGDRFDPQRHWGGVFYFYLRGMGRAGGEGIYHVPADRLGTLEQLEREVGWVLDG